MTEKHWVPVWHQAVTRSLMSGKVYGRNKTAAFTFRAPVSGTKIRLTFRNLYGSGPYEIGTVRVYAGNHSCIVTRENRQSFRILPGEKAVSDACDLEVRRGDAVEIRIFHPGIIAENNMIEENAQMFSGDRTIREKGEKSQKPLLEKIIGAYGGVPSLELAEVLSEQPARVIAAFGDSITALSRWTKPLAERLDEAYPGEYVLLNSGISGNCLLYEPDGFFGPVFGEKGTSRFERDVLDLPDLHAVILGLGVNDVSYYTAETADVINTENYRRAVTEMTERLHSRGVRVIAQTISPRLGVARTMEKYTQEMEELRLELNRWIRTAGIFDYVFDAEEVVRDEHKDGLYYAEGLHQGNHLHPNAEGGKKLAYAYDLARLTGISDSKE
ncbi:MAG: hypothetical protein IKG46_14370 [Solobacterium sp.]|nr:hypothetical protein [Solobacterium sp.]